jgi:hypothetical protein
MKGHIRRRRPDLLNRLKTGKTVREPRLPPARHGLGVLCDLGGLGVESPGRRPTTAPGMATQARATVKYGELRLVERLTEIPRGVWSSRTARKTGKT